MLVSQQGIIAGAIRGKQYESDRNETWNLGEEANPCNLKPAGIAQFEDAAGLVRYDKWAVVGVLKVILSWFAKNMQILAQQQSLCRAC